MSMNSIVLRNMKCTLLSLAIVLTHGCGGVIILIPIRYLLINIINMKYLIYQHDELCFIYPMMIANWYQSPRTDIETCALIQINEKIISN